MHFHSNPYDIVNAGFEAVLAMAQLMILCESLNGKRKHEVPNVFLWTAMSMWGLFSLSMYQSLDFWWSFVGGVACAGCNAALIVLAMARRGDKIDDTIQSFEFPPEMWEGRVYFDKQEKKLKVAVHGQWVG